MLDFVYKWAGGDDAPCLQEAEAYAKTLNVRREPADGQLGLLATAVVRRAPQWPIACLKAILQAPELFCKRKGEASLFTSADIKNIKDKLMPKLIEAAGIMEKARA